MKKLLVALFLSIMSGAIFAADVGVSITLGQPGFYGRIDIGHVPPPQLIYAAPVVIQAYPVTDIREPLYLHVPPGHEKKWRKHCKRYQACGRPVYFVRSGWYSDVYVPHYKTLTDQHHNSNGKKHAKHDKHSNGNKHGHAKKNQGNKDD